MKQWKQVSNDKVKSLWKCSGCGATVEVHPHDLSKSGIPVCLSNQSCEGTELDYVKTMIEE